MLGNLILDFSISKVYEREREKRKLINMCSVVAGTGRRGKERKKSEDNND